MPDKQQPGQPQPHSSAPEKVPLLSAREAALQLRARRALTAGDPLVQWMAGAYVAPLWWWRLLLTGPITVGRPPK